MKKIIILILVGLVFSPSFAAEGANNKVLTFARFVTGKVVYKRNGKTKKVKIKTIFNKDDIVVTKKGKVDIQIGPSSVIRLGRYSSLHLSELYEKQAVQKIFLTLNKGRLFSKITKKVNTGSYYRVKTPTAVAGIRGTEFLVSVASDSKKKSKTKLESGVYVNTGAVNITRSGKSVVCKKNNQVLLTTNALKAEILSKYAKQRMKIFKGLKVMREKNYQMLKAQIEKNRELLESIKNKNKGQNEKSRSEFEKKKEEILRKAGKKTSSSETSESNTDSSDSENEVNKVEEEN